MTLRRPQRAPGERSETSPDSRAFREAIDVLGGRMKYGLPSEGHSTVNGTAPVHVLPPKHPARIR